MAYSDELNRLFKNTKSIASSLGGKQAGKQASKQAVKQIATRLAPMAGGGVLSSVVAPLAGAVLTGQFLGDVIRNNNISLPTTKNKEKDIQRILEETNIQRQLSGLPEIDLYGKNISKPIQTPIKKEQQVQQPIKNNSYIDSMGLPPIDNIGEMINKLQSGEDIYPTQSSANIPNLPPIEELSNSQSSQTEAQPSPEELKDLFNEILSLKQQSAQQRQGIYQPQLDYLQRYLDEYNKATKWQARQSAIASGLAGFANNPLIYQNAIANDPRKQMAGLVDLLGQQAQLKDQLRFDPSQIQADAQLAMSEGFSPLLSVGSKDIVNAIATAKRLQDTNSIAQLKLLMEQAKYNRENERYQDTLKQQNLDNMFKLMGLKLQEDKANKPDEGKILPEGSVKTISEIDTANNQLNTLRDKVSEMSDYLKDPIKARLAVLNPYGKEAQLYRQFIATTKQVIGKGLEGGVLRKEDEYKYDKIIPRIGDTDEILRGKIDQLQQMLNSNKDLYIKNLEGAGYNVGRIKQPQTDRNSLEQEMRRRGLIK